MEDAAVEFALGGAAGSLSETLMLPALVVRTRLMVQGADATARQYSGFFHALQTILREEGYSALYKGMAASMTFTPLAQGLYTTGFEASRATFGEGTPLRDFASGTSAQLLSSFVYVPRDIIVERCAVDGQLAGQSGPTARTSLAALRTILGREGLHGLYRAYVPHQLVWVPFNGLMFTCIGQMEQAEARAQLPQTYLLGVLNTLVSAAAAAVVTNPIDVVKTRLQVAGARPEVFAYEGQLDCLRQLLAKEGPGALFSGLVGRIMFVAPSFALFLPTYDLLKRYYGRS